MKTTKKIRDLAATMSPDDVFAIRSGRADKDDVELAADFAFERMKRNASPLCACHNGGQADPRDCNFCADYDFMERN